MTGKTNAYVLDSAELVAIYVLLRRHEQDLDERLLLAKEHIEDTLYERLSIEEMENIETLYDEGKNPLA